MRKSRLLTQLARGTIGLAFGALLLGTSCSVSDIRDAMVVAGVDFVEDSASAVLNTMITVEQILGRD